MALVSACADVLIARQVSPVEDPGDGLARAGLFIRSGCIYGSLEGVVSWPLMSGDGRHFLSITFV
jgi:hypothetical protein